MSHRLINAAACALFLTAATCFAAQGLTVFHVGNSLTDETYGIHNIAQGFGYTWTGYIYGKSSIPGCPLWLLWSENVKKTADKSTGNCGFFLEYTTLTGGEWIDQKYPALWSTSLYLRTKPYDVLILQVFPSNGDSYNNKPTVDGAIGYAGEVYKSNPNCQVYIYISHADVGKKGDTTEFARIYEPIAKAVTAKYPANKPALVLPIHYVWNKVMAAGYTDLWKSATDGHVNDYGKYILTTTIFSCIYKRDPVGAITTGYNITPAYAAKVQQIAWDVLKSYPMSGVGGTAVTGRHQPVPIVDRSLARVRTVNLAGQVVPDRYGRKTIRPNNISRTIPAR